MNSSMNYYELLGVSETASKEEISQAYKKQMKKWHPDINKSDEAPMMSIKLNEAKEILLDDEKRKAYDLSLKQEVHDTYNKYNRQRASQTNNYNNTNYNQTENTTYQETKKVTKWEYFKEYIKFSTDSKMRKFWAIIGVGLESFLCFVIKILIIGIAYISSWCSYLIMVTFNLMAPLFGIFLIVIVVNFLTKGFNSVLNNSALMNLVIGCGLLYVLMLVLPVLARKIISPKVFDILYNKIDINLFKKCVGYKD